MRARRRGRVRSERYVRRGPGGLPGDRGSPGAWRLLLTAAVLLVAGCDSGPSGPGTITVFATGPSLGGVVLEVRGSGIRGFEARGSARVYSAAVEGRPGTHRVIVISPEPGELVLDIEVADLGVDAPTATVVSAADGDNRALRSADVSVRVGG